MAQEIQAERAIRMYKFSGGYVSVPREDVDIREFIEGFGFGGGFLPGFAFDSRYFCFHSHDPLNESRVLYREVTTDPPRQSQSL